MTRAGALGLILFQLASLPAGAAGDNYQLWTEAGVRYRISKQLGLRFDQHVRFHDDLTEVMPELAVSYRPLRFLRLVGGYRFIAEAEKIGDSRQWHQFHRFFADVRLRLRLEPVTLRYRLRFQEVFGWEGATHSTFTSEQAVRNRIKAEAKLGAGFEPSVSTELFNRLDDSRRTWFKVRLTAGLDYVLDSHRFTLSYRLEVYLFEDTQGATTRSKGERNHILALGYHFSF